MSGAKRVVLWRIDTQAGLVRTEAVAGGAAPSAHILHGSAITWVARERISSRLDPVPVWSNAKRVIGIPVLEETSLRALTFELDDDVDISPSKFDALGIYIGALLSVLDDHAVLADYQARTEHLLTALRTLPTASSAESVTQQLVDAARSITGGDGAAVTLGADQDDAHSLTALAARRNTTLVHGGAALRSLPVLTAGERIQPAPDFAVAVPLATQGQVVAVLTAWSTSRITEMAVSALETIAPYAAAQLLHAHELSVMRALAERDTLTGLHNRRAFDQHFDAEAARFERYRRPFALILLDIDHFKTVNDQYGHDAGDDVLRRVGETIASSLRDVDIAARYGGEEFALLLPETDKARAIEIAERIRDRMEKLDVSWRGAPIGVTISAGVAAMPEHNRRIGDLVRDADQLLYRAKREGRNRITF
jgi:diguanylate cyclase (GGDEF)-like protein